jgi:putative peptide zinc metalloprotease protein
MRTDVYFVLQDLTGTANLYAEGSAYLRYLGGRATRRIRPARAPGADPSRGYPAARRRAVRLYSALLLAGTAVCLGIEFAVTLPALITLIGHAVAELGTSAAAAADGGAALAILLGFQLLWANQWRHRHWHQVRSAARRHLPTRKEVRGHGRQVPDIR